MIAIASTIQGLQSLPFHSCKLRTCKLGVGLDLDAIDHRDRAFRAFRQSAGPTPMFE